MKAKQKTLLTAATAASMLAVLPTLAAATVASPVRAVFLKEFSKTAYTMDQGQILVFENDDPFLAHGLTGGPLLAPTIPPGQTRLVHSAPFLGAGTYAFHDPAHPEMGSSLTITASGSRLPADAVRPTATTKIVTSAGRAAKSGKIKIRLTPSEPLDASIRAVGGSGPLGVGTRTYAAVLPAAVIIALDPATKNQAAGGVTLQIKLTDAAGNRTKRTAALGGGAKKKKP